MLAKAQEQIDRKTLGWADYYALNGWLSKELRKRDLVKSLCVRRIKAKAEAESRSLNFAKGELEKGDQMVRETELVLAEAIEIVAALYKDGIQQKPKSYTYAFPDFLALHDAPSTIEHQLWLMFMEYRMRAFQGSFHANPDYAFWYGWSPLKQGLVEIKEKAQEMRKKAGK